LFLQYLGHWILLHIPNQNDFYPFNFVSRCWRLWLASESTKYRVAVHDKGHRGSWLYWHHSHGRCFTTKQ
jgi:hypothetical protein